MEVLVSAIEHLFGHASAARDWLMYSGATRGASRVRDSRQRTRRRHERRREEQQRESLATGEPRRCVRRAPESPLAGERIAVRRNASASRVLVGGGSSAVTRRL